MARMRIKGSAVLPNLITVGNGICGFGALVKVLKVQVIAGDGPVGTFEGDAFFVTAAWLILLGMVFDVFDGRVARLTGKTSDLGAQLDSLCDLITFGLAPALLVVRMNMIYPKVWQNWVWFFCLLYFVGALLRLARFNVENDHDEGAHLCFKGLPSPAAAGCIATMAIFYFYFQHFASYELHYLSAYKESLQACVAWIPFGLPVLAAFLGYTMVHTRLKFDHVASRLFSRKYSIEFISYIVFGGILVAALPEVILPAIFVGYLLYTPCHALYRLARGDRRVPPPPGSNGSGGETHSPPSDGMGGDGGRVFDLEQRET